MNPDEKLTRSDLLFVGAISVAVWIAHSAAVIALWEWLT